MASTASVSHCFNHPASTETWAACAKKPTTGLGSSPVTQLPKKSGQTQKGEEHWLPGRAAVWAECSVMQRWNECRFNASQKNRSRSLVQQDAASPGGDAFTAQQ